MVDKASTSLHQSIGETSELTVEINIKTLESQIYTFHVEKNMPILALKEKLANAIGVPVERQRLIFNGKVLKDDHLLSEYNVEDGHTLHLVSRQPAQEQPSPGTGSNQGNDSTAGSPYNRLGHISHSVVLGPVNMAYPGELMLADIGRLQLVGEALNSWGVRADGVASRMPSATAAPSGVERDGTQTDTSRAASGSPLPPSFTTLHQPFQSVHQIPQFATTRTLYQNMVIPDSLATLSEFINHMELALQNGGSPSHEPANSRDPLRSQIPRSDGRGLPTPETLGSIMQQAQQLLGHNATAALSHVATRLMRESTLTDPAERGQIQSEAMHVGVSMQHLGAMLLELGCTILTLRMGLSPAESAINAGPAVYISGTGPNPIMVQPFPLQTNSLFGVPPSPLIRGASDSIAAGDPSRNVNIHIRAGNSVSPRESFVATSSGDAVLGESQFAEQASNNNNGSADSASTRGFPSRTVVAAIPVRGTSETAGQVLRIVYPVHVSTQHAVPIHSTSAQGSHPPSSSGTQPNMPTPIPQTSIEPTNIPSLVAQISAQVANAFAHNPQSLMSSSSNGRSSETQGSRSSLTSQTLPTQINVQVASGNNTQGQSSSSSVQTSDISCSREGSQLYSTELLSDLVEDNVRCQAQNEVGADTIGSGASVESSVTETSMPVIEGQQLEEENLHCSVNMDSRQNSEMLDDSSTATSTETSAVEPSYTLSNKSNKSVTKALEKNSAIVHASSGHASESEKPAPLGLGLGGLQPKRRMKAGKPVGKDELPHEKPSTSQNQQSTARRQHFLNSLVSQSSDVNKVNTNDSHNPLPMEWEGGTGQVDAAAMMSNMIQSPIFNNLLTGVAAQAGIGSSADLRSMFDQIIHSPALGNTMNAIVEQVEGQSQDAGDMLSGVGRGQGGLDLSRMIQQMMPAVSQALGRSSAQPASIPCPQPEHQLQDTGAMLSGVGRSRGGLDFSRIMQQMMLAASQALGGVSAQLAAIPLQPERQLRCNDDTNGRDDVLHEKNSKVDLQQVVERIEQHDSSADIFRAVLEIASNLHCEANNSELVSELVDNEELIDEFMNMVSNDLRRRLQSDHQSEEWF